jgi:Tfp pilus assembly protein PilX
MAFVRQSRQGVAMLVALVCLLVVGLIGAALVRQLVLRQRQSLLQQQQMQAFWLAESGLERAVAQLAVSPDYEGETWRVAAKSLGGRDRGLVVIRVESVRDEPNRRRIQVEARFPDDPVRGVLQRKDAIANNVGLEGES